VATLEPELCALHTSKASFHVSKQNTHTLKPSIPILFAWERAHGQKPSTTALQLWWVLAQSCCSGRVACSAKRKHNGPKRASRVWAKRTRPREREREKGESAQGTVQGEGSDENNANKNLRFYEQHNHHQHEHQHQLAVLPPFPAECLAPFLPTRQRLIPFVPQLRTDLGMAAYLSGTRSFRSILLSVGPFYWSLLRQQIAHRLSHLGTTRRIRNYNWNFVPTLNEVGGTFRPAKECERRRY